MPLVVSDTSPIRALEFVDCLEVLPALFDPILVPPAVANELQRPAVRYHPISVADYPFLDVVAPTDQRQVKDLLPSLDRGEAEAIVLAQECRADAVLIDEADGRKIAQQLGLGVIGTLGILLRAKQRGDLTALAPVMDRLRDELGFFISPALREEVLRRADELA